MERIAEILQVLLYVFTMNPTLTPPALPNYTGGIMLASFPVEIQEKFVSRAMGEARGDGPEAVGKVIGTMICRYEEGYGSPNQVLTAYYAPDFPVSTELVASFGHTRCEGFKYALSSNDREYLKIPDQHSTDCVGDTCFYKVWIDNR